MIWSHKYFFLAVFFFKIHIFRSRGKFTFFRSSFLYVFCSRDGYKASPDPWEFNPEWLFTNVNSLSKLESDYKFGRKRSFRSVDPPCGGRAMGESQGRAGVERRQSGVGPLVTKELMRGESRVAQLPDMHNSVWFEICIRTWRVSLPLSLSLSHLQKRHPGLRESRRIETIYDTEPRCESLLCITCDWLIWMSIRNEARILLMFNTLAQNSRDISYSWRSDEDVTRGCIMQRHHVVSSLSACKLWL